MRGQREPPRRAEWIAAGLLFIFVVLTLLVRFRWTRGVVADAAVVKAANDYALSHHWVVTAATTVSLFGSPLVLIFAMGLLAFTLMHRHRPRAALFVGAVAACGAGVSSLLKALLARPRPVLVDPVAFAAGRSFPSGHAMNSAVCYSLLISAILFSGLVPSRRLRIAGVAVVSLIPFLVGISRIALDVHFVSDVLGGWTLGAAWVALATAIFRPWRRDIPERMQ